MATNIPPHNLGRNDRRDVPDALTIPTATTEELMKVLPGPDFPTGGVIMGKKRYSQTRTRLVAVQSHDSLRNTRSSRARTARSSIVDYRDSLSGESPRTSSQKLGELIRDKKLPEISNVHDGADRHSPVDIIIELKAERPSPGRASTSSIKHTQLQVGFGRHHAGLGRRRAARTLSLKEVLHHYILHQEDVVARRTQVTSWRKAEERAHILEGLLVALGQHRRESSSIIRSAATDRRSGVCSPHRALSACTDAQTRGPFSRCACAASPVWSVTKLEAELAELHRAASLTTSAFLSDREPRASRSSRKRCSKIKAIVTTRLAARKLAAAAKEIDVEDLIADERHGRYGDEGRLREAPACRDLSSSRNAAARARQAVSLKDNDFVEHLSWPATHSYMLFFSSSGKVYRLKVYQIPEASAAKHAAPAIVNLLPLEKGETIAAVIATKDFPEDEYLVFATEPGHGQEDLHELCTTARRRDGLIAINLKDGDKLIAVAPRAARRACVDHCLPAPARRSPGTSLRFAAMGRGTMGVRGITPSRRRASALGHGDRPAEAFRAVRNHREGLRQAHPHRGVPHATSWWSRCLHHQHDGEEGYAR